MKIKLRMDLIIGKGPEGVEVQGRGWQRLEDDAPEHSITYRRRLIGRVDARRLRASTRLTGHARAPSCFRAHTPTRRRRPAATRFGARARRLGGKTYTLNYASSGSPDVPDVSSRVYSIKDGSTTLVQYDYVGAGQVVGTTYDEPDVFSKQYTSTAGDYADLDRFNRVVTSKWTKDLASDVDFYKVGLTYDRNSNILTADEDDDHDHGQVGFDVKYTMDNLNRLTVADEGTLSGGSITAGRASRIGR